MKLFVQARKDGYNILYPKTTPTEFYQFASDLRPIAKMGVSFLGKEIYSIAFSSGGCIFTKHIIVQDVQRESLGNVGFSIYIPNEKKLLGIEVKALLDELLETYRETYCADYYLNNKQVDWKIFQSLADSYDKKLSPVSAEDVDNYQSDNNVEAFVYYNNDSELYRYFDAPFQEIYIPYKQVFFIDRNLEKMEDNPLNALQYDSNANLTGKIDLENPFYKLREFHGSGKNDITITIKNSKGRQLYNKDKIFRKEDLIIVYSKKHYHEKKIVGSLLHNEELRKYLIVNENDKKIDVRKDLDLEPNPKTITFDVVKKKNSIKVNYALINCKNNNLPNKIAVNNKITFSPEELEQKWIISANIISENLYSDEIQIIPVNHEIDVPLILNERIKVEITATNEYGIVSDFTVRIREKNINEKRAEIEFVNDEIDTNWNVEVSKYEEGNSYSANSQFCPRDSKKIDIVLKKEIKTQPLNVKYEIDSGKNGKLTPNCLKYSYFRDGSDLSSGIVICDRGWEFNGWKLNELENILIAQYKQKESIFRKPKVIVVLAFGVIILSIGIWSLVSFFNPDKNNEPIDKMGILNYIEGDSLILSQLHYYKVSLENQKPNLEENGGNIFDLFGFAKKETDFTEYNRWYKVKQSLDSAITKRELVDNKNFTKLEKLKYSIPQQKFKLAIENLKSKNKYGEVKNQLVDISNLTLTKIADSINTILNKTSNDNLKKQEEEPEDKNLIEQIPETKQAPPPSSKKTVITTPNQKVSESEDNPMSIQLQSSSITKKQLSEYKEKFPTDKAIQLYLDFWKIITSNQKTDFDDLLKKVNKNDTLKKSELKKILNTICKNEDEFNKFSRTEGRATCKTLGELKSKIK